MKMGRRPLPNALKLVTGSRWITPDEPVARPGWPQCPDHLGTVAVKEWHRLATLLEGGDRLTLSDGPMLTGAAVAYEAALQVKRRLKARGLPADVWLRMRTAERMQWEQ